MSSVMTLPGDMISAIEEFEAGSNAFDDGDKVRAAVIGTADINRTDRVVNISRRSQIPVPDVGDTIIGTVAAVLTSMIAITIQYINGRRVSSGVECICSTRSSNRKNIALVSDIVVLKIVNRINGAIHATFGEPQLGVLHTRCRKCGDKVIRYRDIIKCRECGWKDERKLSSDFESADFVTLSKR